jgi:hypothetical protein
LDFTGKGILVNAWFEIASKMQSTFFGGASFAIAAWQGSSITKMGAK